MSRDSLYWRDATSKGGPGFGAQTSAWQITGAVTQTAAEATQFFLQPNQLMTTPYFTSRSVTIDRLGLSVGVVGSWVQLGAYQVGCAGTLLPNARLVTTQVSVGVTGAAIVSDIIDLSVRADTLTWFAVLAISSVRLVGHDESHTVPIFGVDGSSGRLAYGAVTASWNALDGLPATFPTAVTYAASYQPIIACAIKTEAV